MRPRLRRPKPKIRIGACVTDLDQARQAELEGVEVGVGDAAERLDIADPKVRGDTRSRCRRRACPSVRSVIGPLQLVPAGHRSPCPGLDRAEYRCGPRFGRAQVILLAFFSNGDLLDAKERVEEADVDAAVERIKAAAPRAKDAGVILGIENYLNGEQNARILDRINQESVQLYFDVYNTGTTKRHNVSADIKRLQGRIAQFHFKNGDKYLDDEKAKFEPIAAAIKEIDYKGWIVLETSSPSRNAVPTPRGTATTSARSSHESEGPRERSIRSANGGAGVCLFCLHPPKREGVVLGCRVTS